MPKIKWGSGTNGEALTADDIDNAEEGYAPYTGDIPPAGVYRFRIQSIKSWKSSNNNPGIKLLFVLDGSWKPEHRKYDGAPVWDQVMIMKSSAGFVKAFANAIGATSRDIISNVVSDTDGYITSIGPVKPQDMLVLLNVTRGRQSEDHPWRLEVVGSGYMAVTDDTSTAEPVAEERAGKGSGKKSKKGKGSKADDDEPPF